MLVTDSVHDCNGSSGMFNAKDITRNYLFIRFGKWVCEASSKFQRFEFTKTNYSLLFNIRSTTEGSNRVLVSPKFDFSPLAILRKIRRIIFPERVLGKPATI